MLTVRDALNLPVFRRGLAEAVGGHEHLDRQVRWAHPLDVADIANLLKGGELVLSTGLGAGRDARSQRRFIRQLCDQQAAGLAIELGTSFHRRLPDALTAEASSRGLPLIVFRRQVRFVEITEVVHQELMSRQLALLRRGEELHRELTALVLDGQGVPEMLERLARTIGNPVVLEDADRELVCSATHGADTASALAAWQDFRRSGEDDHPGALAVGVHLLQRRWGRLVALELDSPLDEFDGVALDRAVAAISLQLLREQHEEHLRARSRGSFLAELARGTLDEADARRRGGALGFSSGGGLVPLAAHLRNSARLGPDALEAVWSGVVPDLRRVFSSCGRDVLIGTLEADLVVVVGLGTQPRSVKVVNQVADAFHGAVARRGLTPGDVALAVGPLSTSWTELGATLPRTVHHAGAAGAEEPARWYDAGRSHVTDLVFALRADPDLLRFVDDQLKPLTAAGTRHQVLLETLEMYLANGCSKARTARDLHLERQSLYHRLNRIEQLLGTSLEDQDTLLGLHLALRSRRVLRRAASPEDAQRHVARGTT